ncbi:MAG: PqqD family protein [Legionella sp.]|nr:PqqD family protein [Legionella sp.]
MQKDLVPTLSTQPDHQAPFIQALTTNDLSLDSVFIRNNQIFSAPFEDNLICFDEATGNYYHLNATGRFVWDLLQESLSIATIILKVSAEFLLEQDIAAADVTTFILSLYKAGLLNEEMKEVCSESKEACLLKNAEPIFFQGDVIPYEPPIMTYILPTTLALSKPGNPAETTLILGRVS